MLEKLKYGVEAALVNTEGRRRRETVFAAVLDAVEKGGADVFEALEAVAPFVAPMDLVHMGYQMGRAEGLREAELPELQVRGRVF